MGKDVKCTPLGVGYPHNESLMDNLQVAELAGDNMINQTVDCWVFKETSGIHPLVATS